MPRRRTAAGAVPLFVSALVPATTPMLTSTTVPLTPASGRRRRQPVAMGDAQAIEMLRQIYFAPPIPPTRGIGP